MGSHGICWSRAEKGDHRYQLEDYLAWQHISGGGVSDQWLAAEPRVDRLADGIPAQVDRLRVLGNAAVPAVIEHIGKLIQEDHLWRQEVAVNDASQ